MFFKYPIDFSIKELAPGMTLNLIWGRNVMISYAELKPNLQSPTHSHHHEQAGIIIEGSAELVIGDEVCSCTKGDAFVVPPNIEHSATTGPEGCKVIETFHPIRDDYIEEFKTE